ncbi:MAG: DinB family protein [Chloroflexota bacterium]|nr:MAG: DinB family protein [Chloroflexota bacterium]
MPHPLVHQLRFTRSEFSRAFRGVTDDDARRRLEPMNSISWIIGHLAWQEQAYFLGYGQGQRLFPHIHREFANGAPASTPALQDMQSAWLAITQAADPWLDTLTPATLQQNVVSQGKPIAYTYGNLLQRVIYHYWYHTGEIMAIRQLLGHSRLPQFVGALDSKAPYRPEQPLTADDAP